MLDRFRCNTSIKQKKRIRLKSGGLQHVCLLCLQFREMHWHAKKKTKRTEKEEKTSQRLCFGRGRKLNAEIEQTRFEMSRIRRYLRTVCRTWVSDECRRHVIAKPVSGSTCQSCNSAGRAKRQNRQTAACCRPDSRRRTRWWSSSSSSFYQPRYGRPRDGGHPIKLKEAAQTLGYL